MQKYRADVSVKQADGATIWFAKWRRGLAIAKIENCQIMGLEGGMRRTVYITGELDTFFSAPAVCMLGSCRMRGYVNQDDDDGNFVFRHCYY